MFIDYENLNDNDKRVVREYLGVNRISSFYFEDNNIILMTPDNLFQYIYLDEVSKVKDAIVLINRITDMEIKSEDVYKTIKQKVLETHDKVKKISDDVYLYRDI